jgi:hypothetical protein
MTFGAPGTLADGRAGLGTTAGRTLGGERSDYGNNY